MKWKDNRYTQIRRIKKQTNRWTQELQCDKKWHSVKSPRQRNEELQGPPPKTEETVQIPCTTNWRTVYWPASWCGQLPSPPRPWTWCRGCRWWPGFWTWSRISWWAPRLSRWPPTCSPTRWERAAWKPTESISEVVVCDQSLGLVRRTRSPDWAADTDTAQATRSEDEVVGSSSWSGSSSSDGQSRQLSLYLLLVVIVGGVRGFMVWGVEDSDDSVRWVQYFSFQISVVLLNDCNGCSSYSHWVFLKNIFKKKKNTVRVDFVWLGSVSVSNVLYSDNFGITDIGCLKQHKRASRSCSK